jgi:hypothetical protein
MTYVQSRCNQKVLMMTYMESHSNSIGTLLKSSDHGTWISCAIDIFGALDLLLHIYMVDFGPDNLPFLHSSFIIYFSDILSLFVSLPFLLTMYCH